MEIYKLKDELPVSNIRTKTSDARRSLDSDFGVLKITGLKQGVKNPNRVNVYVNNEYSFSLDVTQIVDFKLKVGQSIDLEKLDEFKSASEFGKLYQRTLEWVLTRPRSIKETQDYLNGKLRIILREHFTISEEQAGKGLYINASRNEQVREKYSEFSEQIIERLISRGYLDDLKFAKWYVENRFVKKGVSRKKLEMELIKKGISREILDEVLDGRDDEDEVKKMIAKKRNKYDDEKLIAYLCRQGFSYDLVKRVLNED